MTQLKDDRFATAGAQNLHEAQIANDYVKLLTKIGASDRLGDVVRSGGKSVSGMAGQRAAVGPARRSMLIFEREIELMAQAVRDTGVGNCGEQAAVAFIYLRNSTYRPLDYISVEVGFSIFRLYHAFVVIGRLPDGWVEARFPTSRLSDPGSWGDDAVICDPWRREAYYANEYDSHLWKYPKSSIISECRLE